MSDLPFSWSEILLSDLGMPNEQVVLTGPFGANLGREDFIASGVPVFTIGCLGADGIDKSKLLHVSTQKAKELAAYCLREGDFLFSRMASVGRAGFVPAELDGALFNYHLMRLRLNGEAVLPNLFYYYVRGSETVRQYLKKVSRGATRDGINTQLLRNMPVRLPPLVEQRRIVAKIDSLSAKSKRARDQLDHIPRLVEKYKQAILAAAFRGELTREWRQAHQTGSAWRDVTLQDIAEIQSGIALGKKRTTHTRLIERSYLRVANVQRGWLDLNEIKQIKVTEPEASRLYLRRGDILMNEGGDRDKLGRGWFWEGQIDNCIHQNHVFRVRLRDPAFPPKLISLYANEIGQSHFFDEGTQTTNLASISKTRLSSLPLRLPPVREAHEILARVEAAFSWIDRLASETTSARRLVDHLDQAILAKAFRGELVPQDPNDEPASVLLERIKAEREGQVPAKRSKRAGK